MPDSTPQDDSEPPEESQSSEGLSSESKLAEAGVSEKDLLEASPLSGLDMHDHEALRGMDYHQDIELKKSYAKWLLIFIGFQLVMADLVFIGYATGEAWHLDDGVIQIWLAATFVELLGVVIIVTQYLFPKRDRRPTADPLA